MWEELEGQTLLVLGFSAEGQLAHDLLLGFQVVLAKRRGLPQINLWEDFVTRCQKMEALESCLDRRLPC